MSSKYVSDKLLLNDLKRKTECVMLMHEMGWGGGGVGGRAGGGGGVVLQVEEIRIKNFVTMIFLHNCQWPIDLIKQVLILGCPSTQHMHNTCLRCLRAAIKDATVCDR